MSDEHRFERDARAWLELGPTDAPDRIVEAALFEIEQTSQERDFRVPWRNTTMNSRLGLAAAALVVAFAASLIYLNLPGRNDVGAPSPTPTLSAPTSTPGTTPVASAVDYSTTPGWIVFEHFGQAPDGSTTEFNNDLRQIWLVHADGTNLHELAPGNPVGKISPDISPDGATVVFESWERLSRLYQAPIEGGDATLIDIAIQCVPTANIECHQSDPAYSPSGDRIAFVKNVYSAPTVSSQIGIHDLRSGQTRLLEATLVTDGVLAQPTWSPDGLQLAYHHDTMPDIEQPPTQIRIEVVNVDGTDLHELPAPDGEAEAADPDWSPDGSLIVFSTMANREGEGRGGSTGIFTIHPDGTGITDLCGGCLQGGIAPSWTPDGKHILFWGFRTWALMDPDGGNMAHINSAKLTWFGDVLGYGYYAQLQPTP